MAEAKIEDVVWNPPLAARGRTQSDSRVLLETLNPGDVKRIHHPDLFCEHRNRNGRSLGYYCSLTVAISMLRKRGWKVKAYHEEVHVMVIRRIQ